MPSERNARRLHLIDSGSPYGSSAQPPSSGEVAAVVRAIRAVMDLPPEDAERRRVMAWKHDVIARIETGTTLTDSGQSAVPELLPPAC